MRAVIKRVSEAGVALKGDLKASIERGLCVLVAFHRDDTHGDIVHMIEKILHTKVFSCEGETSQRTVVEEGLEILCVSQPVLFGVVRENGLEYPDAMSDERADLFFKALVAALRECHGQEKVKDSFHGDYMELHIDNDGAFTLMVDSRDE